MAFQLFDSQLEPSYHRPAKTARETHTLPNSQSSSFNDSSASQHSNTNFHSASNQNPASNYSTLIEAATPATSVSNASTQDYNLEYDESPYATSQPKNTMTTIPTPQTVQQVHAAVHPGQSSQMHTSAPKRMANGDIKYSPGSVSTSPTQVGHSAHSRSSSTHSRNEEINEMARKLQTNLSYGWFKVQNDCEDRRISELEEMAPHKTIAVSAQRGMSKASVSSPHNHPQSSRSPSLTARTTNHTKPQKLPMSASSNQRNPKTTGMSPPNATTSLQQPVTYESFWREHGQTSSSTPQTSHPKPSSGTAPSLAPPVDIHPRSPQRAPMNQSRAPPPRLQTNSAPTTPQRYPASSVRSPADLNEDERDVVDSLMAMSSPKKPGYSPNNPTISSPLRNVIQPTQEARPIQTRTLPNTSRTKSPRVKLAPAPRLSRAPMSDKEMNERLDMIEDDSSDDADDENYRAHRVVSGGLKR